MSAYGVFQRVSPVLSQLPPTYWNTTNSKNPTDTVTITVHHLTLPLARELPGLLNYLSLVFAKEVDDGMTYPQEGEVTLEAFEAYFFAADVFIGLVGGSPSSPSSVFPTPPPSSSSLALSTPGPHRGPIDDGTIADTLTVDGARADREWAASIAGFYYVKPNYPGRSSHICNAGFVVPPQHRGRGYGLALAKSYVTNAPKLGYKASVFNLVYVNNLASVRLWESLGFIKAGLIPRAGRLKRPDGRGEHYVDAYVFYKSFAADAEQAEGVDAGPAE